MTSLPRDHAFPASRRAWLALGALLLAGFATLGFVVVLSHAVARIERAEFDPRPLQRIEKQKPDVVFIGNSMVYTRFDEPLLNELVRPTKVKLLATPAAESAIWYAQFKYYVAAPRTGVKRAVIFFRDRELTLPHLRTTGRFRTNIERASAKRDPVIAKKLAVVEKGLLEEVRLTLAHLVPLERVRAGVTDSLDDFVLRASSGFGRATLKVLHDRVNDLFRVEALRDQADEARTLDDELTPFADVVDGSFLPDLIEVARQRNIELWLVRVKKRRVAEGRPEKPGVPEYIVDLRRYLKEHGVHYIDLTPNRWESIDLYGSGDHISPRHERDYTRLFVQHYPELFAFRPDDRRR